MHASYLRYTHYSKNEFNVSRPAKWIEKKIITCKPRAQQGNTNYYVLIVITGIAARWRCDTVISITQSYALLGDIYLLI